MCYMKMVNSTVFVKERLDAYTQKVEKHAIAFYKQGIRSLFDHVKKNNTKKNTLLLEFQHALRNIAKWTPEVKTHEWARFCEACPAKTLKTLLELKTLVIKGFNAPCDISGEQLIYECYLNIARELWKNPYVVYDTGMTSIERNEKNRLLEKLIRRCFGATLLDVVSRIEDIDDDSSQEEEAVEEEDDASQAEAAVEEEDDASQVEAAVEEEDDASQAETAVSQVETAVEEDVASQAETAVEEDVASQAETAVEENAVSQVETAVEEPKDTEFDIRVPMDEPKEIRRITIPQHMTLLEKKKLIKDKLRTKRVAKDSFF